MNLYWLFKNSPYVLQRKRLTIDAATIASMLTIAEVDNVKSGLDTLMERQYLSVGDFGIIGNIETGGYTFFTIDGRSGMKEGSLNALMTLNPTDINSMYQLPGFEALFHSNKKSAGKNCALKEWPGLVLNWNIWRFSYSYMCNSSGKGNYAFSN